jgi:signal peptidase II
VVCVSFRTAGAIGNVIDCIAYGQLFNDPIAPQVAQFLPEEGGYASLFNGKVVDMLYFPLAEWDWPEWMPWVGGRHYLFFQPIFNIADACLTTSIFVMILFYGKYIAGEKKERDGVNKEVNDSDSDDSVTGNNQE